jgi:hypothetical protein
VWEKKPAEAAEGEDAWSPRQVAEHAIPSEIWWASEVCIACGYPGLEPIEGNYPTAEAALEAFEAASAKADGRLKYVSDTDLEKVHERMGPVSRVMELNIDHLDGHAKQIQAVVAQG